MLKLLNYYTEFTISSSYNIPEFLHQLIYKIWLDKYEELYEDVEVNKNYLEHPLEDGCKNILSFFYENNESHLNYIFMAIILAEAVKPTVKAYLPDNRKTEQVYEWLSKYLEKKIEFKNIIKGSEIAIDEIFPTISVGCQAIDEALDVFHNVLRVIEPQQAQEALLEILDDCLEGYAIFPGSQGRRDLFNWWLLEVVPAAWCLQLPRKLYTINGLIDFCPEQQIIDIASMAKEVIRAYQLWESGV